MKTATRHLPILFGSAAALFYSSAAFAEGAEAPRKNPLDDIQNYEALKLFSHLVFGIENEDIAVLARTDGSVGYDFNSQSDLAIAKSPEDIRVWRYKADYNARLYFDDYGESDEEDDIFSETFLKASAEWWGDDDENEASEPERQGVSAGFGFLHDDAGYGTGIGYNEGLVHTLQKLDLEGWRVDGGLSANLNLDRVWNPLGADAETVSATFFYQQDKFSIDQTTTITPFGGAYGDAIGWEGISVDRDRFGLSLSKEAVFDCNLLPGLFISPFVQLDLGKEDTSAHVSQQITSPAALSIPQFNQQLDLEDDGFFIEPTLGLGFEYFISSQVSIGAELNLILTQNQVFERLSDGNARYYDFNEERNTESFFGASAHWYFQ